jgi:hypothetical protein
MTRRSFFGVPVGWGCHRRSSRVLPSDSLVTESNLANGGVDLHLYETAASTLEA